MKEIDKNSIDELLIKYLTGIAKDNERQQTDEWLNSNKENRAYFNKFQTVWDASSNIKQYGEIDTESSLKNVKGKIDFSTETKTKIRPLWVAMRVAAIIVVALGLFWIFSDNAGTSGNISKVKVESLDKLKTISLPDGSVVTLNSNSVIEYPESFTGDKRQVKFEGEAYFEVAPDKSKPFIIETTSSKTKVVGTAFNLKTQTGNKRASIVVTEGIVEFSGKSTNTKEPVRLVKGDMAILDSELKKEKNSDPNFMAWKTGVLTFDNQKLGEAIKVISEFYKTEFKIADEELKGLELGGRYEKGLSIKDLTEVLEMSLSVKIEKQGETYWLKKKTE